jgi:hypothetical protein
MKNGIKTRSRVYGIFMCFFLQMITGTPALQAGVPLLASAWQSACNYPGLSAGSVQTFEIN